MSKELGQRWLDRNHPQIAKGLAKKKAENPARKTKKKTRRAGKVSARDAEKLAAAGVTPMGKPAADYRRDEGFYKSSAWRTLRYAALKNCGGRCQCCGAPASEDSRLHVDHIIPRYKAPHLSLDIANLQVLCEDCNVGKGAWDSPDWRQHFRSI